MTCGGCKSSIESALNALDGVVAQADLTTKTVTIHNSKNLNKDQLQQALLEKGKYFLEQL